jgi:hypothetical protein
MDTTILDKLLDLDFINSIRANHALEHATFHVLTQKGLKTALFGLSDATGFWVLGNIASGELLDSAQEALLRLQGGESQLSVHENCGTNLAVTGVIVGGLTWLAMLRTGKGFGSKLLRLPSMIIMATLGFLIAQPLGPVVQEKFTTLPNGRRREIIGVYRYGFSNWKIQRVTTRYAEG